MRPVLYTYIIRTMEDEEPLKIGDRVQLRQAPYVQGRVWDLVRGVIIVKWNNQDENAYIRDPDTLQKIS